MVESCNLFGVGQNSCYQKYIGFRLERKRFDGILSTDEAVDFKTAINFTLDKPSTMFMLNLTMGFIFKLASSKAEYNGDKKSAQLLNSLFLKFWKGPNKGSVLERPVQHCLTIDEANALKKYELDESDFVIIKGALYLTEKGELTSLIQKANKKFTGIDDNTTTKFNSNNFLFLQIAELYEYIQEEASARINANAKYQFPVPTKDFYFKELNPYGDSSKKYY